ncbi:hypothetical protein ABT033_22450 [Streptomyces pharetrae]|uniref:hypothetical protein n=1 Tax=Streptomyces pharetrae TaxID=291370 RepID=UPI00335DF01B
MLLPLTHLEAELIEVVRITDPARHLTSRSLEGETVGLWDGGEAREVFELIAALPTGERHRCFLPGWGIRAHGSAGPLFEVAFCFRCHGARSWGPDLAAGQRSQAFDGESPTARELLRRFRACGSE